MALINLDQISKFQTTAVSLGNVIMVTPDPNNYYKDQQSYIVDGDPTTIDTNDTFLFTYEGENTITLDADITDHYIENNSAIQDQIGIRPEIVTVQGYIGELNNAPEYQALKVARTLAEKLYQVSAYTPALSIAALQAYNTAVQLTTSAVNLANNAISRWNNPLGEVDGIAGNDPQNKQQVVFNKFYGWYKNRTFFTIQTPWQIMDNMVIKTLQATQSPDTRTITEFNITFKKMRFASTKLINAPTDTVNATQKQGRLGVQSQAQKDLGTSTPPQATKTATSLTTKVAG